MRERVEEKEEYQVERKNKADRVREKMNLESFLAVSLPRASGDPAPKMKGWGF